MCKSLQGVFGNNECINPPLLKERTNVFIFLFFTRAINFAVTRLHYYYCSSLASHSYTFLLLIIKVANSFTFSFDLTSKCFLQHRNTGLNAFLCFPIVPMWFNFALNNKLIESIKHFGKCSIKFLNDEVSDL